MRSITLVLITVQTAARMIAPVSSDIAISLVNPLGIASAHWLNVVTLVTAIAIIFGSGMCGVVAVWIRLRGSGGTDHARMQWLVTGVTWLVGLSLVGVIVGRTGTAADVWQGIGMLGLVGTLAVGAVRHQLFDVGAALSRTIVYMLLTAFLLLAYVAVIAGSGAFAPERKATLAVIGIAALLAAAARD